MKLFLGFCAGLAAVLLMTACSDSGGGGTLNVTLKEWSITLDKTSLPEGPIDFTIKNDGEKTHEIVIVKTDIPPDQLPTKSDGSVDTGAADVHEERKADEIEKGDETGRTFELDAGNYVFIDNTVEDQDGQKTAYYQQGMRVAFTVTKKDESPGVTATAAASSSAAPTATSPASATPAPTSS